MLDIPVCVRAFFSCTNAYVYHTVNQLHWSVWCDIYSVGVSVTLAAAEWKICYDLRMNGPVQFMVR